MSILGRATIAAIAMASSLAVAGPKQQAAADFAEGQKKFKAGDYNGAASKFTSAYYADPDPVYLFNAAQAHRLAKNCAIALDLYKKFLGVAPNAPNKTKVEGYITEMKACSPVVEAEPNKVAPKPDPAPPDTEVEPKRVANPDPDPKPGPARQVDRPHRSHRKTIGAVSLGLGAVALVGGVVFVRRVSKAESDRDGLCPDPCTWTPDLEQQATALDDRGHSAQTGAVVSFAVAGALVGAGTFLLLTGTPAAEHVSLVPTRGGGALAARFRF